MVESESVDAVVITLVLCSVKDVAKVVSQIKRVLVPVSDDHLVRVVLFSRNVHI